MTYLFNWLLYWWLWSYLPELCYWHPSNYICFT